MAGFHPLRGCFLFQKSAAELPARRKVWFYLWNWTLVVLAALALGILSLMLACGTRSYAVFYGYFQVPMIMLLNLLPPLVLMLTLYAATGRAWIAWLVSSVVILLPSLVNYYMLSFRDDPFSASNLLLMREGMAIAGNYTIEFGARVWLCLLSVPVGAVLLALLARGRNGWRPRVIVLAVLLLSIWPLSQLYTSQTIYEEKTENYEFLAKKRATDRFLGKGFWYPFLYSMQDLAGTAKDGLQADVEYTGDDATVTVQPSEPAVEEEQPAPKVTYASADIPEGQKVDIVMMMLEAFSDLSQLNIEGLSEDVYAPWHALEEESYHGRLVTNIFAAGTVNTERCALTGDFWVPADGYTQDAGSYVRYLARQGYTVTGSHPIYGWFYDREHINQYLGFEGYQFWEDRYQYMVNDIADYLYRDDLFMSDVFELYLGGTNRQWVQAEDGSMEIAPLELESERKPYFGFHVSYQGHATYSSTGLAWGSGYYTAPEGVSWESYYILNNYLGSVNNTIRQLVTLRDRLAAQEEPVILVLFGDHKPWLGDGNSVYNELGINLDTDTQEGFYNYYTTPYLIWANDAAKELLGNDFTGQGPDISAAYLMNELFDLCGWDGPSYMQMMRDLEPLLPVVNPEGYYVQDGHMVETLDETAEKALAQVKQVADFRRTHVGDVKIVTEAIQ